MRHCASKRAYSEFNSEQAAIVSCLLSFCQSCHAGSNPASAQPLLKMAPRETGAGGMRELHKSLPEVPNADTEQLSPM